MRTSKSRNQHEAKISCYKVRPVFGTHISCARSRHCTIWTPSNVFMSCSSQCKFFNYELVINNVFYFSVFLSLRYF